MRRTFYITTPIYYVNDKPHIGHAYTTILADVLAQYHRLLGDDTFFLTGTDEHGQKVQKAAQAAGITAQQQADQTVVRFQELWKKLGITNDDFIRTTEPRHKSIVQKILQDLYDRGEIYRSEYDGWYDVTSETFVTDKDIPEGQTPESLKLVRIKEANYFFKMSKYQDWLVDYIQKNPGFIQPDSRRNETLGFLRKPLQDLCISRPKSRLAWGIDLPFDKDYVTYVWFDALVNYISVPGYLTDDARFGKWWPADYHLIGKDILTTHTVYWPTMLKAMGLEMPTCVFAHGWWLMGDAKMSKSAGNVVNPMDLTEKYGVDAFRYFLMTEMVLGQDGSFTEDAFVRRYNADLANDLGNLLSRLANMTGRYCDGRLPAPAENALAGTDEKQVWDAVQAAAAQMEKSIVEMKLDQGLAQVIASVKSINKYLEQKQPWTLAKQEDQSALRTTLYTAAESLRVTAGLLYPVMPEKMSRLRAALGMTDPKPVLNNLHVWGVLKPGAPISFEGSLFPRIEATAGKSDEKKTASAEGIVAFEDFAKVQFRTARVLEAVKVDGADKLLRLQILVGEERRQVVAGIAQHYKPEDVVGKTVVVVANLKPAKIRGVESNGMLLAATSGDSLRLITVDGDLPAGAVVK